MDITQSLNLFVSHMSVSCPLKDIRTKRNLSQSQLSILSNIPLRTIKAYEQGSVDIAKAQAETLYALAKCTIEDLIQQFFLWLSVNPDSLFLLLTVLF